MDLSLPYHVTNDTPHGRRPRAKQAHRGYVKKLKIIKRNRKRELENKKNGEQEEQEDRERGPWG